MAFGGTLVTHGRGRGIVTATGIGTEMGMIARMMAAIEEEATPLQRRSTNSANRSASSPWVCVRLCLWWKIVRNTDLGSSPALVIQVFAR